MSSEQPMDRPALAQPARTWRPMVLWTAGLLLVLGIVWFVAAVAVPVWRLKASVIRCHDTMAGYPHIWPTAFAKQTVAGLGSPRRAVLCIKLYCLLPESRAPHREDAMTLLQYCGRPAMPVLLSYLTDPNELVRGRAAESLGALGEPETIGRIAPLLKDSERFVRESAAIALGTIGDPRAIPVLAEALKDREGRVRGYAAISLGDIGGPDVVPLLIQATHDEDDHVRWVAAKGLGEIGSERAVAPLCQLLGDRDSSVRKAAAEALGRIGTGARSAVPALEKLLADEYPHIRAAAAEALRKIKGEEPAKP